MSSFILNSLLFDNIFCSRKQKSTSIKMVDFEDLVTIYKKNISIHEFDKHY